MDKLIAAINMTIDGVCDHTAGIADEEIHRLYSELLDGAGLILYGRITYGLMESYWPEVVAEPTGNPSIDDFAVSIDRIPKMVFSSTLQKVSWPTARLKRELVKEEVEELKASADKPILAGSRSMIIALTQMGLVDEYQFCVHPVIAGKGLLLFDRITERTLLRLTKTKTLDSGAVILYYEASS